MNQKDILDNQKVISKKGDSKNLCAKFARVQVCVWAREFFETPHIGIGKSSSGIRTNKVAQLRGKLGRAFL